MSGETEQTARVAIRLGVGENGEMLRIILDDCQRYVIPLDKALADGDYEPPSMFDHFVIDQAHIRNVTFEVLGAPPPGSP